MRRSTFLKYGFAGSAMLALGGVGLSLRKGPLAALPEGGLKALNPRQWSTLVAAASAIIGGSVDLPSAKDLNTAGMVDEILASLNPDLKDELCLVLNLLENPVAGAILDARPTPFSALSHDECVAAIEQWRGSRLPPRRAGIRALIALVNSAYWSRPETWSHMGYPGPLRFGGAQ